MMENDEITKPSEQWKVTDEWKEYNSLAKKNGSKAQLLQLDGIQMDGMSMLQNRMELLIEAVFPSNSFERVLFELHWQRKIAATLKEADQHAARIKLMTPQAVRSDFILPNGT